MNHEQLPLERLKTEAERWVAYLENGGSAAFTAAKELCDLIQKAHDLGASRTVSERRLMDEIQHLPNAGRQGDAKALAADVNLQPAAPAPSSPPSAVECKSEIVEAPGIGPMRWCEPCAIYFGKDQPCPTDRFKSRTPSSDAGKAIGECEECGHQIVTPLTPLPVAWRFKNNPHVQWEYRGYPPAGLGGDAIVEPLFSSPSVASANAHTDREKELLHALKIARAWMADDKALTNPEKQSWAIVLDTKRVDEIIAATDRKVRHD